MNITNDIHTKMLGALCLAGYVLIANHHYQTSVTGNWESAERLSTMEFLITAFFFTMPLYGALFRYHGKGLSEFDPAPEQLEKMSKFRHAMNTKKGIERIYVTFLYLLPVGFCYLFLSKGFQ